MKVTSLLATRSLDRHRAAWAAVFAALLLTSALLGSFALALGSTALGGPGAVRYAGAAVVVAGNQSSALTAKPWGSDPQTVRAALTERVLVPRETVEVVAGLPGIRSAVADEVFTMAVGAPDAQGDGPGDGEGPLAVPGRSWEAAALAPYPLHTGRAPDGPGEVVLADGLGAAPGDQVTLSVGDTPPSVYEVVGVAGGPDAGYVTADVARRLAGDREGVDAVGVIAEPGVSTSVTYARVREAVDTAGLVEVTAGQRAAGDSGALRVLTGDSRGGPEQLSVPPLRSGLLELLGAVAATMVLVSLLVVSSLVAQATRQRAEELALLRAVGATPGQLRAVVSREVSRVALWAAALGAVAAAPAFLGLRWLLRAGEAWPDGMRLPAPPWLFAGVLVTAGVTVGVGWLAAWLGVRRLATLPPSRALSEAATEPPKPGAVRQGAGAALVLLGATSAGMGALLGGEAAAMAASSAVVTMAIGCALLGPWIATGAMRVLDRPLRRLGGAGGRLAAANCTVFSARLGAAITSIVLVTAFALVQLSSGATVLRETGTQTERALRADLTVTAPGGLPADAVRQVGGRPGVDAVTEVLDSTVLLAGSELGEPQLERLPVLGVTAPGLARALDPAVSVGELAELEPGTVAVGADRARALDLEVDSTVELRFGDGATDTLRVVALYEHSFALGDFLLSLEQLTEHVTAPRASRLLVTTTAEADPSTVSGDLETALRPVAAGVHVARDARLEQPLAAGQETEQVLNQVAVASIGGLASVAVLSTLALITVGRRPELARLRQLGASRGQLRWMLTAETAVVGAAGLVLGMVVAVVPLSAFSLAVVSSWPYLPAGQLALIVAVVVATTAAGALLPARGALRRHR